MLLNSKMAPPEWQLVTAVPLHCYRHVLLLHALIFISALLASIVVETKPESLSGVFSRFPFYFILLLFLNT